MIDVMLVVTRGREAVAEETLEVTIDQTIRADETYVRHLFRNLFENAVEHGDADVIVTVGDLRPASTSKMAGSASRRTTERRYSNRATRPRAVAAGRGWD